jgi:hypothetical protein
MSLPARAIELRRGERIRVRADSALPSKPRAEPSRETWVAFAASMDDREPLLRTGAGPLYIDIANRPKEKPWR